MKPGDDRELIIQALERELKERENDRAVILTSEERDMLVWALRYFDAESEIERTRINSSMPKSWDRDVVREMIRRLTELS